MKIVNFSRLPIPRPVWGDGDDEWDGSGVPKEVIFEKGSGGGGEEVSFRFC